VKGEREMNGLISKEWHGDIWAAHRWSDDGVSDGGKGKTNREREDVRWGKCNTLLT
jgi:hypothetical protein